MFQGSPTLFLFLGTEANKHLHGSCSAGWLTAPSAARRRRWLLRHERCRAVGALPGLTQRPRMCHARASAAGRAPCCTRCTQAGCLRLRPPGAGAVLVSAHLLALQLAALRLPCTALTQFFPHGTRQCRRRLDLAPAPWVGSLASRPVFASDLCACGRVGQRFCVACILYQETLHTARLAAAAAHACVKSQPIALLSWACMPRELTRPWGGSVRRVQSA